MHQDQVGFIPGMKDCFNICKPIDMIYHSNRIKDKNVILIKAEKAFQKFSINIYDKNSQQNSYKRKPPQHNETIYFKKSTTNIIINGEKVKVFPLKFSIKQECLPSPLLCNIVLKALR